MDLCHLLGQISFLFMQFLAKILPNNGFLPQTQRFAPSREILEQLRTLILLYAENYIIVKHVFSVVRVPTMMEETQVEIPDGVIGANSYGAERHLSLETGYQSVVEAPGPFLPTDRCYGANHASVFVALVTDL